MLTSDAGIETKHLCEPRPDRSGRAARGLAALSQTPLRSRFLAWRGASGRSYVFSVFPPSDCPAFCDAVLMAVSRDARGGRRILEAVDTGAFPEPVLARAERDLGGAAGALEFHVHLLAPTLSERRAALADLCGRTSSPTRRPTDPP